MALGTNLGKKTLLTKHSAEKNLSKEERKDDNSHKSNEIFEEAIVSKSQYCVFKSGTEEYAISIDAVKEVVKFSEPAPIPQMPTYILGMSNVRGNIYGVMDLECFFKGFTAETDHNYLLVLDHDTYKMAIAIEEVPNSILVADDHLEQLNTSSFKSVIGRQFLKGIIKLEDRMIILLNVLDMVASEDFTTLTNRKKGKK